MTSLTIATLGDLGGAYQLNGVRCRCRCMRQIDLAMLLERAEWLCGLAGAASDEML